MFEMYTFFILFFCDVDNRRSDLLFSKHNFLSLTNWKCLKFISTGCLWCFSLPSGVQPGGRLLAGSLSEVESSYGALPEGVSSSCLGCAALLPG